MDFLLNLNEFGSWTRLYFANDFCLCRIIGSCCQDGKNISHQSMIGEVKDLELNQYSDGLDLLESGEC